MNRQVIDPEDAIGQLLEYTVSNGMTELIVMTTLEQRLHMIADLTVIPTADIAPLQLCNVSLPNLVISHTRSFINYEFDIQRINIS